MPGITEEICDPKRYSTQDAIRVARQRASEDLSYDLQIVQFVNSLWMAHTIDMRALDRGLEILGAIASPGRTVIVASGAVAAAVRRLRTWRASSARLISNVARSSTPAIAQVNAMEEPP